MHRHNTSELENLAKKIFRKFWYWNHEKPKKVLVLGQENFLIKKRVRTFKYNKSFPEIPFQLELLVIISIIINDS